MLMICIVSSYHEDTAPSLSSSAPLSSYCSPFALCRRSGSRASLGFVRFSLNHAVLRYMAKSISRYFLPRRVAARRHKFFFQRGRIVTLGLRACTRSTSTVALRFFGGPRQIDGNGQASLNTKMFFYGRFVPYDTE